MTFDLDRFTSAQDRGDFATALAELRAGRKQSHWMWYVFPQLRGLGSSPLAVRYGLDGIGEAEAYLRDPVLRTRLHQVTSAVHVQLCERRAKLEVLMGSRTDALKLVSSMTLFERVARTVRIAEPAGELTELAERAADVLTAAEAQGYGRCEFTLRQVRAAR